MHNVHRHERLWSRLRRGCAGWTSSFKDILHANVTIKVAMTAIIEAKKMGLRSLYPEPPTLAFLNPFTTFRSRPGEAVAHLAQQ